MVRVTEQGPQLLTEVAIKMTLTVHVYVLLLTNVLVQMKN